MSQSVESCRSQDDNAECKTHQSLSWIGFTSRRTPEPINSINYHNISFLTMWTLFLGTLHSFSIIVVFGGHFFVDNTATQYMKNNILYLVKHRLT